MKRLTAKEEEIMNFFWEKGPLFVKEIVQMYPDPKPHPNTVSTVVRGLEEKGYIAHESFGSTYRYHAAISRDTFKKKTLGQIISKYFDNSYLSAVSALVRDEKISLEELQQLIREVKQKHPNP